MSRQASKAFAAGFEAAASGICGNATPPCAHQVSSRCKAGRTGKALIDQWNALETRATAFPAPVRDMALSGLRAVVDFQDLAYGRDYLERIDTVLGGG